MSARQAFIPRAPSRAQSIELHAHSTDARNMDGDGDMFTSGNGKPRSIAAFLGQKRATGTDAASQEAGQTQGPGLGRANTSANRRSLEGILRPEMMPMSIIPYPTTVQQLGPGTKQSGAGQTTRKTPGPGGFEFPGLMTPVSVPRGLKKGAAFAGSVEDEATLNGSAPGSDMVFAGPGATRIGAGTGMSGYMRMFEGSGTVGSENGAQSSLDHNIVAPVPGYAHGGLGVNVRPEGCETDGIFARSSRLLNAMTETEVGVERNNDPQRCLGGTKRGMHHEDVGEDARYTDEGHQTLRAATKRMRQVEHDPDDYFPISSPHIPPTPAVPTSSLAVPEASLVAGALFENIEEFISLEEIEADWKRWKECSTEEWLKGADELLETYTGILNMVKDHLAEKVVAYAGMVASVEKRQSEVNRDIEIIRQKGSTVRENISKLGL